jgi:hypothetical protein
MTVVWTESAEERAYREIVDRLRTPRSVRMLKAIWRGLLVIAFVGISR